MKLVLDANIFIAAFFAKGLASDILRLGETGRIQIYTSEAILDEVEGKLIEKAKLNRHLVEKFIRHLGKAVHLVKHRRRLHVIKADPDDNKILECAVEANVNLIISMDKHLIKLKTYEHIGIVHPRTLTWILPKLL